MGHRIERPDFNSKANFFPKHEMEINYETCVSPNSLLNLFLRIKPCLLRIL